MLKRESLQKSVMFIVATGAAHRITQVSEFDYADHFEAYHRDTAKRPTELVLDIILPGVPSLSDIHCEVLPSLVSVKAPGVFQSRKVHHDFEIKLPCEVQLTRDYRASYSEPVLTLTLDVKPLLITRVPFTLTPPKSDQDDDEPVTPAVPDQIAQQHSRDPTVGATSHEDSAIPETLGTNENVSAVMAKDKENGVLLDRATGNPPFSLQSVSDVSMNSTVVELMLGEQEVETPVVEAAPAEEPKDKPDVVALRNTMIYDLEP
jgi:hypothetical protein